MHEQPQTNDPFEMHEPNSIGLHTAYAFWFVTEHEILAEVLAAMPPVAALLEEEEGRYLVEIRDDYDPDEAWHWIRSDLEHERYRVELDPVWEEALKWIL